VFLGYGVYLVSKSVPLAIVVCVAVYALCRFLLGWGATPPTDAP
jgi:hypothetical protein